MPRSFQLKPNEKVTPCPKCGNNTDFTAHSERSREDCCDVWVVCKCGYDPTAENTLDRYESVWGGTNDENVTATLECWNDTIEDKPA